jgi:predicted house-cleaning noncanonical NTP pyrophosphatase (MazG superfamily)
MAFSRKLVRDLIPSIIEQSGRKPIYYKANPDEYFKYLKAKLLEETKEFIESESIEELADLNEVLKAITNFMNIKKEVVLKIQEKKRKQKGGFNKKIILEKIIEANNII